MFIIDKKESLRKRERGILIGQKESNNKKTQTKKEEYIFPNNSRNACVIRKRNWVCVLAV